MSSSHLYSPKKSNDIKDLRAPARGRLQGPNLGPHEQAPLGGPSRAPPGGPMHTLWGARGGPAPKSALSRLELKLILAAF